MNNADFDAIIEYCTSQAHHQSQKGIENWLKDHGSKKGKLFWNALLIYMTLSERYGAPICATSEFWNRVYQVSDYLEVTKQNTRRDFNLISNDMFGYSSKECGATQLYEVICEGIRRSLQSSPTHLLTFNRWIEENNMD